MNMSATEAAFLKDDSGSHAGKTPFGKESKSASGQSERFSKGTPSPTIRVPKLPPSPTLSGRLKSPNSDPGKERKPFAVVPRAVSSENSKPGCTNGASKRSEAMAKFKEAVSKTATDLNIQVLEDRHAAKNGDTKLDSSRKSKETSPNNGPQVSGSEEDSDARRKLKEASPQLSLGSDKKALGKVASPTLCSECKAAAEGAVCFIGNDGRVSACTTRSAVRLCKNFNCAANNPEYLAALAAPKKYLVSKRHTLKAQPVSKIKDRNQHSKERVHFTGASGFKADQKGTPTFHDGASGDEFRFDLDKDPEEHSSQDELEDDDSEYRDNGGSYSGSAGFGRSRSKLSSIGSENGHLNERQSERKLRSESQKMRTRSVDVYEKQDSETVTLRKQLIQERKQAGEWMLDCAMEETVHKLAPAGEPKVKILVQAFERLMSHTDGQ